MNHSRVKGIFWITVKIVPNCIEPFKLFENMTDFEIGKIGIYESMKKLVIRGFDDGLVSAANTT